MIDGANAAFKENDTTVIAAWTLTQTDGVRLVTQE